MGRGYEVFELKGGEPAKGHKGYIKKKIRRYVLYVLLLKDLVIKGIEIICLSLSLPKINYKNR